MKVLRSFCAQIACGFAITFVSGMAWAAESAPIDFGRDVQPILRAHCYDCHGPDEQKNGFRLDRRRDALRGGVGTVIVPGSTASSRLYLRLIGDRYGKQMPPEGPLSAEQIKIIQAWIDQGVSWPDELSGDIPPKPADPDATRLMDTLRSGDRKAFEQLLRDKPESVKKSGAGGSTPLMYAALYGDADQVRALLAAGADANVDNEAGATALMWTVDDVAKTRLLLEARASVKVRSADGQTPLLIAAGRSGASDVIGLLLDRGADPSVVTHSVAGPVTALRKAAELGDLTALRLLLERGADLKAAGPLPLLAAAASGNHACVDLLLPSTDPQAMAGAVLMLAPPRGEPELMHDLALLKKFVAHGFNVNAKDPEGRTVLMLAAATEDVLEESIRTLIASGADVTAKDARGWTAADFARQHGREPIVKLLQGEKLTEPTRERALPKPAASVREALSRSIPLLQRADATFLKKSGCVSCHHNSLTAMTVAAARQHGLRVDDPIARQQLRTAGAYVESRRERLLQGVGGGGESSTVSYTLLGLAADGYKPDLATDAAARYLKNRQLPDGHWPRAGHRPPLGSTEIQVTAMSLRALKDFAPQPQRAQYEQAAERAAAWLRKASPQTTADRAFQLLGLKWAGGNEELIRTAARLLLREPGADGGWSQLPTLPGDAYATGQALYALRESGAVDAKDPVYQKGIEFLLARQLADGSWHVESRSIPFQPYFESDFPHGPDQWISAAATNWASLALIAAATQ